MDGRMNELINKWMSKWIIEQMKERTYKKDKGTNK